jgi:hypothetical protein
MLAAEATTAAVNRLAGIGLRVGLRTSAVEAMTSLDPADYVYPSKPTQQQRQFLLEQMSAICTGHGSASMRPHGTQAGFAPVGGLEYSAGFLSALAIRGARLSGTPDGPGTSNGPPARPRAARGAPQLRMPGPGALQEGPRGAVRPWVPGTGAPDAAPAPPIELLPSQEAPPSSGDRPHLPARARPCRRPGCGAVEA